jgi:glycosyltransferase involved in cell wall biosynthesis
LTTINFITNQPLERETGGWCGISKGIYQALSKKVTVNFVGPVNPGVSGIQKMRSKVLRLLGRPGNFYFFSEQRLEKIRIQLEGMAPASDYDLFFGSTPWIAGRPSRPYGTLVDALFSTYLRVYGRPEQFRAEDLHRVQKTEENWLQGAQHIFWTSDWASRDGALGRDFSGPTKSVIGVGGNLDPPPSDLYTGEKRVLFLAMRFRQKGGVEAFQAFERLWRDFPELKFVVIGEPPPVSIAKHPSVVTLGFLDKTNAAELALLKHELSRAVCLVHPTSMDMTPCALIEANYFGCPVIAPARFGIPEMIKDRVTGILMPQSFTVDDIVHALEEILGAKDSYKRMREEARSWALDKFTYDVMSDKILAAINSTQSG